VFLRPTKNSLYQFGDPTGYRYGKSTILDFSKFSESFNQLLEKLLKPVPPTAPSDAVGKLSSGGLPPTAPIATVSKFPPQACVHLRPLSRPYKLPWRTLTARTTTCMGATAIPTVRRNMKPGNYSGRYARTVLFARLFIATIDGGAALTHVASHCRQQIKLLILPKLKPSKPLPQLSHSI